MCRASAENTQADWNRLLADEIIEAQRREIKEMEWLIRDIRQNGVATTEAEADSRPVPDVTATRLHYPTESVPMHEKAL